MKVVKRVIVGVLVAALAAGGIYTGLMHVKESKVTEVPVTSVSNLQTDWYSETTLDGTITTNVSQNVNMDKDMIIEKIYVSQGDDVKKGDNLISFDMTLVEMELNIAKLKQQKQEQDLTKAQNRLTSLQNGGPIEDSTDSTDDTDLNLTGGDTGNDGEMTNTDTPSGSDGDEDMQSTTGSAATADGSYLAAASSRPLLLSAFTDTEGDLEDSAEKVTEEMPSGETTDSETEQMTGDDTADMEEDTTASDEDLIMDPTYQDPTANDITDGETTDWGSGEDDTPTVSPTPTPTLGPNELPDPNITEPEIPGITDGEPEFYQKLDYTSQPFTGTGTEEDPYVFLVSSAKGKVTVMGSFFNRMAGYSEDGTKVVQKGGSWFQLEFHENDTIADFQDRTLSCTGYYLINGSLLEKSVYEFAEVEFTLADASRYENDDDADNDGSGGGDSTEPAGPTVSRADAIKYQNSKIASLKLDIQESDIKISQLEKKANKKLVSSKLDGTVSYVGDVSSGTTTDGKALLKVKSEDGYYVVGAVSELMLDTVKEGTKLSCTSYTSGQFEAEIMDVSEYPVDSYNYYGDNNPNVSYYAFTAVVDDKSLQFDTPDYVMVELQNSAADNGSMVISKAFVKSENGKNYVYKDDNGVLKKQEIRVGATVDGGYDIIIKGGISSDDKLAFPYGKDVVEGAKTNEVTLDYMYNQ